MAFKKVESGSRRVTFVDPEKIVGYTIDQHGEDVFTVHLDAVGSLYRFHNPEKEHGGWNTSEAAQEAVEQWFRDATITVGGIKEEQEIPPAPDWTKEFTRIHFANARDNQTKCCGKKYPLAEGESWSENPDIITCPSFMGKGERIEPKACGATRGHNRHFWESDNDSDPTYECPGLTFPDLSQVTS